KAEPRGTHARRRARAAAKPHDDDAWRPHRAHLRGRRRIRSRQEAEPRRSAARCARRHRLQRSRARRLSARDLTGRVQMSVESFRGPGGASLYYRDDDFTDPWEKRPIVILAHGHPRNSNMWYAWVPGLARDFRVVRPDLRGLGLSKVPIEGYKNSPEVLMQDAIALMDHLRADKVVWIGEAT